MPSVPLIVLTNGRRDCISHTVASATAHLSGVNGMAIVDTSGSAQYGDWLAEEFVGGPLGGRVLHIPQAATYWQAMQAVWSYARYLTDYLGTDAFAFWEDDFTLTADVDLRDLAGVLADRPYLTQIALRRQPWFANERAHGGLIEALEAQGQHFQEVSDGAHDWIEHRACFTGNPSVIPARTLEHPWPSGDWSESRFGRELFADPRARGAYWGKRGDPPRVEHIGVERIGAGY